MEASHKKHRPDIKVGKDAEEEVSLLCPNAWDTILLRPVIGLWEKPSTTVI